MGPIMFVVTCSVFILKYRVENSYFFFKPRKVRKIWKLSFKLRKVWNIFAPVTPKILTTETPETGVKYAQS